jgi:hypothetical protein
MKNVIYHQIIVLTFFYEKQHFYKGKRAIEASQLTAIKEEWVFLSVNMIVKICFGNNDEYFRCDLFNQLNI